MSDQQWPDEGTPEWDALQKQAAEDHAKALASTQEKAPRTLELKGADGLESSVTAEELRSLSLDQLQSFFGASLLDATEAIGTDQYGPILDTENKGVLVGKPCLFVRWQFNQGDMGEFVSVDVLTRNDDGSEQRYILNDGSTGIYAELKTLTEKKGVNAGLFARHGLRVSTYDKELVKGDGSIVTLKDCKTYYIDTKL